MHLIENYKPVPYSLAHFHCYLWLCIHNLSFRTILFNIHCQWVKRFDKEFSGFRYTPVYYNALIYGEKCIRQYSFASNYKVDYIYLFRKSFSIHIIHNACAYAYFKSALFFKYMHTDDFDACDKSLCILFMHNII